MVNYGMLKNILKSHELSDNHKYINKVKLAKVKKPCIRQ